MTVKLPLEKIVSLSDVVYIEDAEGKTVATMFDETAPFADELVRAANEHDELVSAVLKLYNAGKAALDVDLDINEQTSNLAMNELWSSLLATEEMVKKLKEAR